VLRRVRVCWLIILLPVAVVAAACGGGSPATSSSSSNSAPATTVPPVPTDEPAGLTASIDPLAPLTQTVKAGFDPPFTLRIPDDWTGVLRDISAFQAYAGNEDFEITFDHTYRSKESLEEAIARLTGTQGLTPGPVTAVVVGGLQGKGFVAGSLSAVRFVDSGFHTNQASTLEVIAIPVEDGTTVTVFLTAEGDPEHGLDTLAPLARRIFETVEWR
jgi:hypothetical protein